MLRLLLYPLSIIYDLITRIRNGLFNLGIKKSHSFSTSVIGVGNLNVGGSGKTPMIEYLITLLTDKGSRVATLSRGYGRRTTGFRRATISDNAGTIGDEPFQLFRKFGAHVTVAVGEKRAAAIPLLTADAQSPDVILLDDAFQHRAVRPRLSILLTDYSHPFTRDYVLPAGNLRETRHSARRADIIVVTRSPANPKGRDALLNQIRKYAPAQPVFFAGIMYDTPQPFGVPLQDIRDVLLVTAIARPDHLVDHVRRNYTLLRHFHYPDHHVFSPAELTSIIQEQHKTGAAIVTTEKDMMRLLDPELSHWINDRPWYYIPIKMCFHENGPDFDTIVLRHAR